MKNPPDTEHTVMRYEDHNVFKIFQRVHQHFLGRKSQMVG